MLRDRRVLGWLSVGLVLCCLLVVNSIAVAQQGSIEEANALNQQVLDLYQQGRYEEAIPRAERALAIREKVLGPKHDDTASSLNNLAELYEAMGAYDKAEPLLQRALAIRERLRGPDHLDTALLLKNLAEFYRIVGNYPVAERLFLRALKIWEARDDKKQLKTATALNNLGLVHDAMGHYVQAEPLLQRALSIRERSLDPLDRQIASSLNNLALVYRHTGAYEKAEPLFRRAVNIYDRTLGVEHPSAAMARNNLAELYHASGLVAQAEQLYLQVLTTRRNVLGSGHPDTAQSLNNLADLFRINGAHEKAEPMYQEALTIWENAFGPDYPELAVVLNNLALLRHATGAYRQEEALYSRAAVINEKAFGTEHPTASTMRNNQAAANWSNGNYTAALSLLERTHMIEKKNATLFLLSGSERRKQAFLEQQRGGIFMNVSLSLAMPDSRAVVLGLNSVLHIKGRVLEAMSEGVGQLRLGIKNSDRVLFEQLTDIAQELSTLRYQKSGSLAQNVYRERFSTLSARKEQLESELSIRSAEFRRQTVPANLKDVRVMLPPDGALVEFFYHRPFDPKAKDETVSFGKPRYVAYVLKREGEPVIEDVGEADRIEQLVQDFRTGLSNPTSIYVKDIAKELYGRLLKPLEQHLGHVEHLLISPDGALNLIPFGALVDETGTYVATKMGITYLTSGRDLLRASAISVAKDDAVIFADPDYGHPSTQVAQIDRAVQPTRSLDLDRGGMTFTSLPGTAEEAKTLTALFRISEDHLLMHANATEDRFKQLHGPRILHVATHGFFLKDNELPAAALKQVGFSQDRDPVPLGENPLLRSGLALAGANQRRSGEKDDGILTAAEVAQMDLRGTQLVVLSACETGVGDVQNGEGVYGLRRALVLAGAETQVTSLWKVADEATKDLMVDYYQRLLKGEGRAEALRNAQLTMMKSKERSHPYYWAAFVPIGDWRPLAKGR